jgi:hypothetical protein
MAAGAGEPIDNRWILAGLVGAALLTYLPACTLPYVLLDDNWIIRSGDGNKPYPDLDNFVALTQGRPVFALLLKATRLAASSLGMETLRHVRFLSVFFLGGFAFLLYLWLRRFGIPTAAAVACAAAAITLPAFQMYVAGGPWLTVPLVMTAGAMHLLHTAACAPGLRRPGRWLRAYGAFLLLLLSLATYQTTALVSLSFLLFALLTARPGRVRPGELRFLSVAACVIFTSVLVYYLVWQVAYFAAFPADTESRYNPNALIDLDDESLGSRVIECTTTRVPQNFNLWAITKERTGFYYFTVAAALGGFLAGIVRERRDGLSALRIGLGTLGKVVVGTCLLVFTDLFALASGMPIQSYTSTLAFSLAVFLVVVWGAAGAVLCLPEGLLARPRLRDGSALLAAALVLLAAGVAQKSVTRRMAVPLWLERAFERDRLLAWCREHADNPPSSILVYTRKENFGDSGFQEFTWSNFSQSFYCYWFTRNNLDSLGIDSNKVRIDVFDRSAEKLIPDPRLGMPPAGPDLLEIDFSRMQLHR